MDKKENKKREINWIFLIGFIIIAFFVSVMIIQSTKINKEEMRVENFCNQHNFDNITFTADGGVRQYFCVKDNLAIPLIVNDDGVWIVPKIN